MPECYTHVYLGTEALMRSGNTVASHQAFVAGTNGPDPLYMYRFWARKRVPNLPLLAAAMHREKTGRLLLALVQYATTPVQQSYALGYLTHYTTECTLAPYFGAMAAESGPYAGPSGQWQLGTALDSELYYRDYRSRTVPLRAGSPVLITDELGQVCTLLREAVWEVYGVDVALLALADCFHHNLTARRLMISKSRLTRPLLKMLDSPVTQQFGGPLAERMQPGKKLEKLPQKWQNPYSGQEMDLTLDDVLTLAKQTGAVCISAAMRYWLGEVSEEKLATVLGDNDCATGQPCGVAPPAEAGAETGADEIAVPLEGEQTA